MRRKAIRGVLNFISNSVGRLNIVTTAGAMVLIATIEDAGAATPYSEQFDLVWQTINDHYVDRNFDGLDWTALGAQYRARLTPDLKRDDYIGLVNDMLFQFGRSHMMLLQVDGASHFLPEVFATGTAGLAVRVIGEEILVRAVRTGSSAHRRGISVGDVILRIDGIDAERVIADAAASPVPPFNQRQKQSTATREVYRHLYGAGGSDSLVDVRTRSGAVVTHTLRRHHRDILQDENVHPSGYRLEFSHRVLADGILYVRFNYFAPPADTEFSAIVERHATPAGLIIDLRDNPGGFLTTLERIAGHLLREPVEFYSMRTREGVDRKRLSGNPNAYDGPVVILVDETSLSSSEQFAGSLQALGRATVVGTRTPGHLSGARLKRLPDRLSLIYAFGEPRLPNGQVVEGHGIAPDIAVPYTRESLIEGRDAQLEAAIHHLTSRNGTTPAAK